MQLSVDDTTATITGIALERGQRRWLSLKRGHALEVRSGRLWLTSEDNPVDHVLEAGQVWRAKRDTAVLVEAMGAGVARVDLRVSTSVATARRWPGDLVRKMQLGAPDIGLSWSNMQDHDARS